MQNYFIGVYHVMSSTLLKSTAAWSWLQRCESRQNKIWRKKYCTWGHDYRIARLSNV